MKDYAEFMTRFNQAWDQLPEDLKDSLAPKVEAAHNHLRYHLRSVGRRDASLSQASPPHELLMVKSLRDNDQEGFIAAFQNPAAAGAIPHVGPKGDVFFAGAQYEATDPEWAYAIIALAATQGQRPDFRTDRKDVEIEDDATIALLGDWGGNNQAASDVAASAIITAPPASSYYIHLGDVYYAGTNPSGELKPYETTNFLETWPGQEGRSFALNSNHDMYAQATGYFLTTLASTKFKAQQRASFFALFNKSFRIVGLDSAYYSSEIELYQSGSLGSAEHPEEQAAFLQNQAKAAADSGQTLIILTHHNGLNLDGTNKAPISDGPLPLWTEVTSQLAALKGKSVYWYWGHEHAGAVYNRVQDVDSGVTIRARCCGHGCVPWGRASALENSEHVEWHEKTLLASPPGGQNYFVTNGYAVLKLGDASMTETFYTQAGKVSYTTGPLGRS